MLTGCKCPSKCPSPHILGCPKTILGHPQSTLRHWFAWKMGNNIHDVVLCSRYQFLRNYSQCVVDKSRGLLNIHKSQYVHTATTNMLILTLVLRTSTSTHKNSSLVNTGARFRMEVSSLYGYPWTTLCLIFQKSFTLSCAGMPLV